MPNQISITYLKEIDGLERIDQEVRALIATMQTTLPGSRGFGVPIDVVDLPPEEFRDEFGIALNEELEEYIPEIKLAGMEMRYDPDAKVPLKLEFEYSGENGEVDSE